MVLIVYSVQALATSLASLIIGLSVFLKDRKNLVNKTFFWWTLSVAIWAFGISRHTLANDPASGLMWSRILHGAAIYIPAFFLHFTLSILNVKDKKWIISLSYLGSTVLFLSNFTDLFISGVRKILYFKYFPVPGPIYPCFVLIFSACVIYALYNMFLALRVSSGTKKNQIKYLFLGAAIGFSGGSTTFFPVFNIKIFPIGNFFIFLYISLIAYAILKYRLMNIELAYRQGLIFASYLLGVLLIFLPVGFWLRHYTVGMALTLILIAALSPFIYQYLTKVFRPIFYGQKFGYLEKLKGGMEASQPQYTSGEVAESIVGEISSTMNVENCSLMMYNTWRGQYRPMAHKGLEGVLGDFNIMPKVKWEDDHPIVKYFESNKDVLVKEYLQANPHKEHIPVLDAASQIKAEVIIPIFIEYKLMGMLGIGRKKTGDIFDPSDLNLLRGLVKRRMERDLSHTHYMEEQTVFASKVAHDLRSPFNWILNEIENLRLGVYGELNDEQKKSISKIFDGNQNLERNIRTFFELTVLLQHKVHGEYQVEQKDLKAMILGITDNYQAVGKEKGIKIAAEFLGDPPVIMVLANPRDIRRVFENLISNALRYTPKGGRITAGCKIEEEEGFVKCWVSDTGIGMPKHALPHVFKPFFHLHAAGEDKQSGVGLGLVIVKEIIEAHGGRIWVESKESNPRSFVGAKLSTGTSGSTFYFTLKLAE